ncbi:MarR family winged helix-turn-helix transcriptional regulator [Glacieibacterium frigidum]|uniref:MarR family transcriptional regulator n=1 Tax=Glacieibacterium frigidum TaxID=2593303 RepID=A0A552UGZ7_9SPHN|nr:MarR family transcriptional regulator [Glacieibacterium frigidum]TRW17447.1 MarR family transcriptional regulator [Glacieibacterium frigidum]
MTAALASRPDAPTIDDCIALKVRRLARKVTQIYDDALAPHGLTVGQLGILAGLRRSRGVGIAALAEQRSTDASTVSRLVRPLERAGLLSIEPDPEDRRAKLLRLTDAGAVRVRAAAPAWTAAQAQVGDLLGQSRLSALRFIVDDAFDHL